MATTRATKAVAEHLGLAVTDPGDDRVGEGAWRVSYLLVTLGAMAEETYGIGEGPATRVSLSLPEGTAEAIRSRVGKREFSAFVAGAVERELRGQILDEYLADYENRVGPVCTEARQRAREVFDAVLAEGAAWPAGGLAGWQQQ